jgi:T5SS/PEP-CTERM-associated repeat protein/autotransporter-associated beta strand protein
MVGDTRVRGINKMRAPSRIGPSLLTGGSTAVLMLMSAGGAQAIDWNGSTSSDWTDSSNWAGGVVPVTGQAVNISTPGVPSQRPAVIGVTGPVSVSIAITGIGQAGAVPGVLSIQNGSMLTTTGQARLGIVAGSTGHVTVSGSGSQWIALGPLVLGFFGTGTLNIENGGQISAATTLLGSGVGSSGTLNITSGGTLQAQTLRAGSGASQANFDDGILRATAANATFINGFSGNELNLLAGGLTIDTAGFAVGTDSTSGFSGVGGMTVTGGGIFTLQADSIYAGETQIDPGSSLTLAGAGAVTKSSRVVADGALDVSAATSAAIRSLAGGGTVLLGAQTLAITNANDTFAGVIDGTGGLSLAGGSQALSGVNTYTGATTVSGGRLAINGSVTSPIAISGAGILAGTGTVFGEVTNAGVVAHARNRGRARR